MKRQHRSVKSVKFLEAVSEDFGHVLHGSAVSLIRPRSADEVRKAVADALAAGDKLTLRGTGHSAGGQSLPINSIVLDLSEMRKVTKVDSERCVVTCEAGARLRDVIKETLPYGLLPRVLTNLLDLTVGGLLSVGGIGPGSHRYGPLIANIAGLEVVTGVGQLQYCSRLINPDLYNAVLGGIGRCGVIVKAEIELRYAHPRVRTYYLLYNDHQRWLSDQLILARTEGVSSMEGFCSPCQQGLRGVKGERANFAEWFFPLQVSFEYADKEPTLPSRLAPYRVLHSEADEISYFPSRHDRRFEMLRRTGAWKRLHPYISTFIGVNELSDILPQLLDALPISEGHRGLFFVSPDRLPPLLMMPKTEAVAFLGIMYPQILPQFLNETLSAFKRAREIIHEVGGKPYLADWLGEMSQADWKEHFGTQYERWLESKQKFDPEGVFCSLLIN